MARIARSCVQSLLKVVNSFIGMVGIALFLYALWMIRTWQRHTGESPFDSPDSPRLWFIYTFLGLGVILCVITCSGHIAAETANGCCLYIYMVFVCLILMLEGAVTADVFLNSDWEEDFPEDPTESFDKFKNFVRSNFRVCKWICLLIVVVQVLSILLAMILKGLGPHEHYDSDEEDAPERVSLLKKPIHPSTYVSGDLA